MVGTTALSPHLGVKVTGVGNLLDDTLVSRCLEALKLHRALPYDASAERTLHRTTIAGDEAFA